MTHSDSYLLRRGHTWYFRMAVPRELWPALKRKEIVMSLTTMHFGVARQRSRLASNWLEALFNRMKIDPSALSPQQLDQLVNDYFQQLRQKHFDTAGFPAGLSTTQKQEFISDMQEELHLKQEQMLEMRPTQITQKRLASLFASQGIATPEEGTPAFEHVAAGTQDALIEIDRMIIAKLRGLGLDVQAPSGRFAGLMSGVAQGIATHTSPFPAGHALPQPDKLVLLSTVIEEFIKMKLQNGAWSETTVKDYSRKLGYLT